MNNLLATTTSGLLQSNYRAQGEHALAHRQTALQQLLSQRQLPLQGWNDLYIQSLMNEIAMMDSNNFIDTVGVGEREGRVYSALVRTRHMNLAHGIGRSGDLLAQQPKAAGSSLLLTLTHALTLHAIKLAGFTEAKQVILMPVATGMSIVMALTALKHQHPSFVAAQKSALKYAQSVVQQINRPASGVSDSSSSIPLSAASPSSSPSPLFVIWSRIDQKTCLKSIFACGLTPIVVELLQEGDQLVTNVAAIEQAIQRVGAEKIVAVVTTTSCFAPRAPDKVVEVAQLCQRHSIPHVINNAYGLQSSSTCKLLNSAARKGRVDAVISSLDKNFLVPVGGAMVIGVRNKAPSAADEKKKQQAMKQKQTKKGSDAIATVDTTSSSSAASASSSTSAASAESASSVPSPPSAALPNVLDLISSLYPGRASSSSILDLFLTLLTLGQDGWLTLLKKREDLLPIFREKLMKLAKEHGERVLETKENEISFGITLDSLCSEGGGGATNSQPAPTDSSSTSSTTAATSSLSSSSLPPTKFVPSYLGSLLFSRNVSGPRVLSKHTASSTINGITFQHYGTHTDSYPHAYVTAACGIGMEEREIDAFVARLDKCIKEFKKQREKQQSKGKQTT